jgi:hypothetical protein
MEFPFREKKKFTAENAEFAEKKPVKSIAKKRKIWLYPLLSSHCF